MDRYNMETLLGARAFAYHAMHAVFGQEPTAGTRTVLASGVLDDLAAVFADADCPQVSEAALALQEAARQADDAEMLDNAYTRLLLGPGTLPASPWESTYISKERVLFQESTLDVRRAYVAQDLIPQGYPHVADDHIAIECDFLGKLGHRMVEALEAADEERLRVTASASRSFLREHLGSWADAFARNLCDSTAQTGNPAEAFYAQAAATLARLVEADAVLLQRLVDETC